MSNIFRGGSAHQNKKKISINMENTCVTVGRLAQTGGGDYDEWMTGHGNGSSGVRISPLVDRHFFSIILLAAVRHGFSYLIAGSNKSCSGHKLPIRNLNTRVLIYGKWKRDILNFMYDIGNFVIVVDIAVIKMAFTVQEKWPRTSNPNELLVLGYY